MMSLKNLMPAWVKRIGVTTALLLFVGGIVFWGGFNWALEATNKESFCISCHEMEENVFREYQNTVHYTNRTGVRATCPDCHVPKEWGPKMIRKIQASNEVLHKVLGTIDTPEKFNKKRHELAQHLGCVSRAEQAVLDAIDRHRPAGGDLVGNGGVARQVHRVARHVDAGEG